jgi:hypothetical protein
MFYPHVQSLWTFYFNQNYMDIIKVIGVCDRNSDFAALSLHVTKLGSIH